MKAGTAGGVGNDSELRRRFTQIGSGTIIPSTCAKIPNVNAYHNYNFGLLSIALSIETIRILYGS